MLTLPLSCSLVDITPTHIHTHQHPQPYPHWHPHTANVEAFIIKVKFCPINQSIWQGHTARGALPLSPYDIIQRDLSKQFSMLLPFPFQVLPSIVYWPALPIRFVGVPLVFYSQGCQYHRVTAAMTTMTTVSMISHDSIDSHDQWCQFASSTYCLVSMSHSHWVGQSTWYLKIWIIILYGYWHLHILLLSKSIILKQANPLWDLLIWPAVAMSLPRDVKFSKIYKNTEGYRETLWNA